MKQNEDQIRKKIAEIQSNYGSVEAHAALQYQLDSTIDEYEGIGEEISKLKKKYDVKYAEVAQQFIDKKLQVSVLKTMVKGNSEIASLQEKISNYEHRKGFLEEEINRLKLKIRTNESQINREWYQSGNN